MRPRDIWAVAINIRRKKQNAALGRLVPLAKERLIIRNRRRYIRGDFSRTNADVSSVELLILDCWLRTQPAKSGVCIRYIPYEARRRYIGFKSHSVSIDQEPNITKSHVYWSKRHFVGDKKINLIETVLNGGRKTCVNGRSAPYHSTRCARCCGASAFTTGPA